MNFHKIVAAVNLALGQKNGQDLGVFFTDAYSTIALYGQSLGGVTSPRLRDIYKMLSLSAVRLDTYVITYSSTASSPVFMLSLVWYTHY